MSARRSTHLLNLAALIALLATAIAVAGFIVFVVHKDDAKGAASTLGFAAFGCGCLVLLGCGAIFDKDMKRLGFDAARRRKWGWLGALTGPFALALYWWRYVRNSSPPA